MISSFLGMFAVFMFFLIPVIIITMIIVAIVKRNKDGEKSESFEKIVRMIYVYILLIGFLFMTVGSVIYAFNSAINYYIPESKISAINTTETTRDIAIAPDYQNKEIIRLQNERSLRNEKNQSIIDFSTAVVMLLVAAPMFLYHSKLAGKLK